MSKSQLTTNLHDTIHGGSGELWSTYVYKPPEPFKMKYTKHMHLPTQRGSGSLQIKQSGPVILSIHVLVKIPPTGTKRPLHSYVATEPNSLTLVYKISPLSPLFRKAILFSPFSLRSGHSSEYRKRLYIYK